MKVNYLVFLYTGEKPYDCKLCKAKFSRNCDLNRHLRTHTGKEIF